MNSMDLANLSETIRTLSVSATTLGSISSAIKIDARAKQSIEKILDKIDKLTEKVELD